MGSRVKRECGCMIDFECPECKTQISVPASLKGQWEKCPSCGIISKVPGTMPHSPLTAKTNHSGEKGLAILIAGSILTVIAGFVLGGDIGILIGFAGIISLGVIVSILIGLIPGLIARGKERHKDIRMLGLVGIIVPFCWLAALIWALVDKPAAERARQIPAGAQRYPCPFCGESIAEGARKCRFCGELLPVQRQRLC